MTVDFHSVEQEDSVIPSKLLKEPKKLWSSHRMSLRRPKHFSIPLSKIKYSFSYSFCFITLIKCRYVLLWYKMNLYQTTLSMLPLDLYAISYIYESQCFTLCRVICRLFKAVILPAPRRLGGQVFSLQGWFGWLVFLFNVEILFFT